MGTNSGQTPQQAEIYNTFEIAGVSTDIGIEVQGTRGIGIDEKKLGPSLYDRDLSVVYSASPKNRVYVLVGPAGHKTSLQALNRTG